MSSLQAVTQVKQEDSHTYSANFDAKWTIGQVPHGGYVASVFLQVIKKHFETTLKAQNQPHTITFHTEYLRRTEVGHATFNVKDVKLGRQLSTVHVTLSQKDREEVVCYASNANMDTEQGVSFRTAWSLVPQPPSVDLAKLSQATDPNWAERKSWPFSSFRKAKAHVRLFFPRKGQPHPSICDQWMCLANGENWTNQSLGYVADLFPQMIEVFSSKVDPHSIELEKRMTIEEQEKAYPNPGLWYPTLQLTLHMSKSLPAEGVKWLFLRLTSKSIKNGRFDLEVVITDETGELVAISNHSCLAVNLAKNLAKRRTAEESKL